MLPYYVLLKILNLAESAIFHQDEAPPNLASDVRWYLDTEHPQRWIRIGGTTEGQQSHQT